MLFGAEFGMTEFEVLVAVPGSVVRERPITREQLLDDSGPMFKATFTIALDTAIAGVPIAARFGFLDGRLSNIAGTFDDVRGDYADNMITGNRLLSAFTERFGQPRMVSNEELPQRTIAGTKFAKMNRIKASWYIDRVRATLHCLALERAISGLSEVYVVPGGV